MSAVEREFVVARGEGSWVWDDEGRRYLDAIASLWYCNIGHGRPELAEAAAEQMRELAAFHTYGDFANRPAIELSEALAAKAPMPDARVFFTSGGSDSIDSAAKLVRRHWAAKGQPERQTLLVREGAYHGMHAFGTSLSGIPVNLTGLGDLVEAVIPVPRDDLGGLEALLEQRGHEIAALFAEPVIGAGGAYPPPDGEYWRNVAAACRRHGVLLVMDEVVTGFGRLGHWFGSQRYGIEPDLVVCAKGITSGYLPLGAVICGPAVQESFFGEDSIVFRHGYTYSGHPTTCAVGLRNLQILEAENLIERAAEMEPVLASGLSSLASHPLVGEVRTEGLIGGVELDPAVRASAPTLADAVALEMRDRGVIVRALLGHTLQISPPLVVTEGEIEFLVETMVAALDAGLEKHGAALEAPAPEARAG
jgi:adenosylmethionine-8-amino-7-oxononanoate aminotransferase